MSGGFQTRIVFIEMTTNGAESPQWYSMETSELPVQFSELNGSSGFAKQHPHLLTRIEDPNEWQRMQVMDGVHLMIAIGYE